MAVLLTASIFVAACGGGGDTETTGDAGSMGTTDAGSMGTTTAAAATSTINGVVMYAGAQPTSPKIKMSADPFCEETNAEPRFDESIILGPNGELENVFVYIKAGLEGQTFDVPTTPVVFDQKNCMYEPHIFGIMAKQELQILNSDATLHNVHATPKNSPEFNVGMPTQGMKITKKFKKAEVMVHIKCEVHPWMSAYAGVLDHPIYTVAGSGGSFSLPMVAPGTYTVEAWHEKLGTQTQEVTVGDGETTAISFNFASDVRL
jgi:plastocyanin